MRLKGRLFLGIDYGGFGFNRGALNGCALVRSTLVRVRRVSFRRGRFRMVNADRSHAGEKSAVVRDHDEHEDGADQREDAAPEAAAAGALDEFEKERGGDFEETLPAAGNELALRAIAAPTIKSSPMTTNVMNREFVTLMGPTVKRVSGAIAMWISIRGRYSS